MKTTRQKGFSIVELMIAGVLGLFLISGVVQLFLGSNQNYQTQDNLATIQEDGRLALLVLKEQIQKGGWTNDYLIVPDAINFGAAFTSDATTDSVAVSFNTVIDGVSNKDCNGASVGNGKVINRFYVNNEQLMCEGNGAGAVAQPLIAQVEEFQVLYGVEQPGANLLCQAGVVNNYLTATQVIAGNLMKRVLSVRVSLLIASEGNVLPQVETKNYQVLDKAVVKNDRIARRIFQQSIFMPNAVYATAGNPQSSIDCL